MPLNTQWEVGEMCELERFMKHVIPVPESGCWLWIGGTCTGGYGNFSINGKTKRAHRYSYEAHFGKIPGTMFVCHKCDTPSCVNPDHLFLGTCKQNVQDMLAKRRRPPRERKRTFKQRGEYRGGWKRGELNVNAKLTLDQIIEIRKIAAPFPYDEYVKRLHVARSTLWYARSGRNWR